MNQINKNLMSINHTSLKRSKKDIQWIVIHYVGALGDAKANTDYYKSTNVGASADFWVGFAGDIWQGNDYYNYYSWHCGGGYQSDWTKNGGGEYYGQCTNKNSIGIEMCVRKKSTKTMNATDTDWYFEQATVESTAELVASLMKDLDIDINHVIRHYQVNRKICPNPFVIDNNAWVNFKARIMTYYGGVPLVSQPLYHVRTSWKDEKSQIFAGTLDGAKRCADQHPGYFVYDESGKVLYGTADAVSSTAYTSEAKGIPSSKEEFVSHVSKIAVELYSRTKILPSVIIAQCILESGAGLGADAIELTKRNNILGMKSDLINSSWSTFSVWSGESYRKPTPEEYTKGVITTVYDNFRVYKNYRECITDYEMFLLNVQNNKGYKYRRIAGWTNPAKVINAIRIGTGTNEKPEGYFTDSKYESKIMRIISEYDLTKYDKEAGVMESKVTNIDRYRVAKELKDGKPVNQLGAFSVLENAKAMATTNPGYYVYDIETGEKIFPVQTAPTTEIEFYRVATDYKGGKYVNQTGAYTDKNNAIEAAKAKGRDYKVFSPDGQVIYSAPKVPAKEIYAVRRTLKNVDSQIGLFASLSNAMKMADTYWGYNVYNIETNKTAYKPVLLNWQKVCASAIELGEEMLKDLDAGHQWKYAGSGERTFAKARKKGIYKANCSGGVYWILRNAGVIPDSYSCNWYGTIGGFKWLTPTAQAEARKYFDIIDIHTKTVNQCIKDGTLHPGDIICYETFSHTNMYLGNNTSFDSGHNNCHGSGNGAKFYRWVSPLTCGGYKIAQIMRIKENVAVPTVTQYRVQAGSYLLNDNANNMAAKVKSKGFDAKVVKINGEYIVQLGVFSSRTNADNLVAKLKDSGIVCLITQI